MLQKVRAGRSVYRAAAWHPAQHAMQRIFSRSSACERMQPRCLTHTLSSYDRPCRGLLGGSEKVRPGVRGPPCWELRTPGSTCRPCRGAVCEALRAPETLEETDVWRVQAEAPGQARAARGGRPQPGVAWACSQSRRRPQEECSEHLAEMRGGRQVGSPVHVRAFIASRGTQPLALGPGPCSPTSLLLPSAAPRLPEARQAATVRCCYYPGFGSPEPPLPAEQQQTVHLHFQAHVYSREGGEIDCIYKENH